MMEATMGSNIISLSLAITRTVKIVTKLLRFILIKIEVHGTRLQGEWKSVSSFLVEPGEIGLTALKEAGDGIDQDTKGRLAQLAAGLTQR